MRNELRKFQPTSDCLRVSDIESNHNVEQFDVFLCHNSEDKSEIRQIADELTSRGYKPWLDEREILSGTVWQEVLGSQIGTIKAAAVFVGKSGISPWQQMEIRSFIDQFVKRACPVIPVILSSATETPELPIFLQNFHWVDFRKNHPDPYEHLIGGIRGKKSDLVSGKVSASVLLEPSQDDAEGEQYPPIANQPDEVDRRQLGILRDRVQEYWVDGVLRQSLYHEVLILLGKCTMDEVVERSPWKYDVVDLPVRCRDVLQQDHNINSVFDATGLLLILGEPGSGKTTSLLELAAVLINRTKNYPKERVPIVLNLSSWQKKQSLEEWIAAELSAKYRIPVKIARAWLAKGYLVPLLDGLDEVKTANQPDCVTAINAFIETHNPSGLVVCSRLMEYQWLPKKLKLNGAVCIEPLSPQDVNNFLIAGGQQLMGLQQVLAGDPVLQDLAQTPLMLSIMSMACEGADGGALASIKNDSPKARREQIFQLYVERMFQRRRTITSPFSQEQIMGRLSWLARKMAEESQSVFIVESLQPHWLSSTGQRLTYYAVTVFSIALVVGLVEGLSRGLFAGLASGFFVGSFILGLSNVSISNVLPIPSVKRFAGDDWVPNFGMMLAFLWIGLFLVKSIMEEIDVLHFGLIGTLGGLIGFLGATSPREIHPIETMRWQWKEFWKSAVPLWIGMVLFTMVLALTHEFLEPNRGLLGVVANGLTAWGVLGAFLGLVAGMNRGLVDTVQVEKTSPNQGIMLSMKNGLAAYVLCLLVSRLVIELANIQSSGLLNLQTHRPSFDLSLWLLLGLPVGLNRGGSAVVKHYALRLVLWQTGVTPFRFTPYLDHCAKLILLKKVGGGYMFIHRTLLEYFAALSTQDNTVKKVSPDSAS